MNEMVTVAPTIDEAIAWVHSKKGSIRRQFDKYSPYCSDDFEDFMSVAYVAALEARGTVTEKNVPFEAAFWVLFKLHAIRLNSRPALKDVLIGCDVKTPCRFMGIDDAVLIAADAEDFFERSRREKEEEILVKMSLSAMTKKQREVWEVYLRSSIQSYQDVVSETGLRRQTITPNIVRGLERVAKKAEDFRKLSAPEDIY